MLLRAVDLPVVTLPLIEVDTKLLPTRGGVTIGIHLRQIAVRAPIYYTAVDETMKIGDRKAEQK